MNLLRNRVNKMQLLLDGLLDYARAGKIQEVTETFSVEDVVHKIFDEIKNKGNATITFKAETPIISADKIALIRVLSELIKNGISYNTNASPTIDVTMNDKGEQYEFVVTDNGPGIKPQQQQVVFDIFQTLQSSDQKQTAGVGLTIVKKMVEDRGGQVWLCPAYKNGTQVHFTWKK